MRANCASATTARRSDPSAQAPAGVRSRTARSSASSVASSAMTGTSSRSSRSWVSGDALGSASRSKLQLVPGERPLEGQERAPVERGQAQRADRVAVVARRVALVVLPAVARIAEREPFHHPVADHLRDDRRTGDRVDLGVAVDDVRVRADLRLEPGDPVAVDQDVLVAADPGDRPAHGEMGGVVDVELVDLANRRGPDADRHGSRPDQRGEPLALCGRQRLGVADAGDAMAARSHDHGRRDDRAARRRDADLVHADHPDEPVVPEAALVAEGGDGHGHRRQA